MTAQINENELTVFYSAIGEAIWLLQNLEDVLATYITMKHDISEPGSVTQEKAESLLKKNRKGTLGTLLKVAFENHIMPNELEERFRQFKEERDWLVHRCAHTNREDLYSTKERHQLIYRIRAIGEESIALRKLTFKDLEQFSLSKGVDGNLARVMAISKLDKLKAKA